MSDEDVRLVALVAAALVYAGRGDQAKRASVPIADVLTSAREFEKYIKGE